MGCVTSHLLEGDAAGDQYTDQVGSHVVSLTSTTYGILTTLDHFPSTTPPKTPIPQYTLEMFERRCPPGGEEAVVVYTTTLRGIRSTYENCNAVRSAIEGAGVRVSERDVSMDMKFREELRRVLGVGDEDVVVVPPRVFVRGRYIGGAAEVLRIHEEGGLAGLLEGLPRGRVGSVCDGCGGARFLPCFGCSGSRKLIVGTRSGASTVVVRCTGCNENGLVLCPICS
ncbi:hypothetical protein QJS04_geneDACA020365 [Acorus gramineus]|uniref:Glutaredoxin domain-containing protein n=1 Tax=Acorus gramineus TaxID=55184 RepID=A0AAV9ABB2_ACOGR|nr:hypothetical protein QJS04_geneDACA020298 [Acorus gramineus]KAK1262098.1 hypothetical protein QJS04_geneDACA020365 [Acorus gramineus]